MMPIEMMPEEFYHFWVSGCLHICALKYEIECDDGAHLKEECTPVKVILTSMTLFCTALVCPDQRLQSVR